MERESKIYWLNMSCVGVSVALVTTCDFLRRPFCYRFDSPPDVINVVSYEGFVLTPMSAIIITRCADWLCFVSAQQATLFIAQRAWCMETFCSTIYSQTHKGQTELSNLQASASFFPSNVVSGCNNEMTSGTLGRLFLAGHKIGLWVRGIRFSVRTFLALLRWLRSRIQISLLQPQSSWELITHDAVSRGLWRGGHTCVCFALPAMFLFTESLDVST